MRPAFSKGLVGWYTVKVANPDNAPGIVQAIDAELRQFPLGNEDRNGEAFAASFVKQIGNIEFLILTIGSRRLLHASPRHREHDGHRGPRAHR